MKRVAKLDVLSVAYIQGLIGVGVGLVFGVIMSAGALLLGGFMESAGGEGGAIGGMLFGIGAVVILPIFYGVGGFIGGLITAFIYNIAAKISGGISIKLVEENSSETTASAAHTPSGQFDQ
ncbi:MAG: hypothetical protein WD049_08780 [Candidatus Paceibacterota bacterium]